MYIPKQFIQEDRSQIIEWIQKIQFGAIIIFSENQFRSSHIPFVVREEDGKIILEGHVSKANEIWKHALKSNQTLVIFQGPNSYIHPGFYASKEKDGKVVPTWNFLVIHCHGLLEVIDSSHWILEHLEKLTNQNESYRETPWKMSDAPADFINSLSKSIVGLKITINRVEECLKMNQHHSEENRSSVLKALSSSSQEEELQVAEVMKQIKNSNESCQ